MSNAPNSSIQPRQRKRRQPTSVRSWRAIAANTAQWGQTLGHLPLADTSLHVQACQIDMVPGHWPARKFVETKNASSTGFALKRTARRRKGLAKPMAEAAAIYGTAYGQEPEFYAFLKTLERYKQTLQKNSSLVLTTDSDFYRYLKNAVPDGGEPASNASSTRWAVPNGMDITGAPAHPLSVAKRAYNANVGAMPPRGSSSSSTGKSGYQWRKTALRSWLSILTRICSSRWAVRFVHCIC